MKPFIVEQHVPDVYTRKSRDFQMFCSVLDVLFGEIKFNIDSILDVADTTKCNQRLLSLLQTKLGFFTNEYIRGNQLREILTAFPAILRNKGSLQGIEQAVRLAMRIEGKNDDCAVVIKNKGTTKNSSYIITIGLTDSITNINILNELLKYVVPAGYIVEYGKKAEGNISTNITTSDSLHIVSGPDSLLGSARSVTSVIGDDYLTKRVDTAIVVNNQTRDKQDYTKETKEVRPLKVDLFE